MIRILAITSLALFVIAAPAQAAKGTKGKRGANPGRILSRFDRDKSGAIDGAEVAHVQTAFTALATLDTDKDGKLSESEVAAAKIEAGRKKKAK
jgi:EF hand